MSTYNYHGITIRIIDEPIYKVGSADNQHLYFKRFLSKGVKEYPTSKHGVRIYRDGVEISFFTGATRTSLSKELGLYIFGKAAIN